MLALVPPNKLILQQLKQLQLIQPGLKKFQLIQLYLNQLKLILQLLVTDTFLGVG